MSTRPPLPYEAARPSNEAQRSAAVKALCIMDTPNEERIDVFSRLVSRIFKCPMGGVSLISDDTLFFKSIVGAGPPTVKYDRRISMCQHTIAQEIPKPFVVRDMKEDERFVTHPMLVRQGFHFYAGVPLVSKDGYGLGALCVADRKARPEFNDDDIVILQDLSRMVVQELETSLENSEVKAINKEKEAENVGLHQSNDLLLTAMSVCSEGVIMFNGGLKIIYSNTGWTRVTGYSREESAGKGFDMLAPQPLNVLQNMFERLISGAEDNLDIELECRSKQDAVFWAKCHMSAFKQHQHSTDVHLICVISDITDLKNEQVMLKRAKEEAEHATHIAEVASQAKTNFLTNMSHELRTPLHGILGCVHVLARSTLSPEQRKWAITIQKSCAVLCDIVNDLLDMSKVASKKMKLERHPFDLAALAEEVAEINASNALEKGLDLAVYVPASCMVPILGDRARMQRILMNYVGNAIKFTARGSVVMRAELVAAAPDHVTVKFSVTDTGIGIREADVPLLFKRFSQLDESPARQFGGTGLGLALAKELATMMHGEAGVVSEFGKGATFWFTAVFDRQVIIKPTPTPGANGAPAQPFEGSITAPGATLTSTMLNASQTTTSITYRQPMVKQPTEPLLQVVGLADATLAGYTADEVMGSLTNFRFVVVHPSPNVSGIIHDLLIDSGADCWVQTSFASALVAINKFLKTPDPIDVTEGSVQDRILRQFTSTRAAADNAWDGAPQRADQAAATEAKNEDEDEENSLGMCIVLVDEHADGVHELCTAITADEELSHVVVIVMVNGGTEATHSLPVSATLRKPFTRTALVQALAEVDLGFDDSETDLDVSDPHPPNVPKMVQKSSGAASILVVDDSETNLLVAVEALRSLGYTRVATARSGEKGLELFEEAVKTQPFDVILLDIHMPGGMDGFETCRKLREIERAAPQDSGAGVVPVLAMTAGVTKEELTRCAEAGFSRILDKPWTMDKLESLMNRCILARRGLMDSGSGKFRVSRVGSVENMSRSIGGNFSGEYYWTPPSPAGSDPDLLQSAVSKLRPPPPPTAIVAIRNMIAGMMLGQMLTVEALAPRMAPDLASVDPVAGVPVGAHVLVFTEADAEFPAGMRKLAERVALAAVPLYVAVVALINTGAALPSTPSDVTDHVSIVPLTVPYTPADLKSAVASAQTQLTARRAPEPATALGGTPKPARGLRYVADNAASRGSPVGTLATVPSLTDEPTSPGRGATSSSPRSAGGVLGRGTVPRRRSGLQSELQRAAAASKAQTESLLESSAEDAREQLWGKAYDEKVAASKRILVVDDTPLNVLMMNQYLRDSGLTQIDVAENGQIAVDKFTAAIASRRPYDMILLDILMPVMDGYRAATCMRAEEKRLQLAETPVIAVTANNSDADKQKCLSVGITDYLGKPYESMQLYHVMSKYLRSG